MPPNIQKQEKWYLILDAAALVFAKRGYNRTLVADIAAQADIGKGTIYEYFSSKEDLFFAVFEWLTKQSGAKANIGISALGGSVSDRLKALSDSLMHQWMEARDLYTLVMEFWSASASSKMRDRFKEAFREAYKDFRHIVSTLISEGIDRGEFSTNVDAEAIAAALVGTWDALLLQAWFDEEFNPLLAARKHMAIVLRGMSSGKKNTQ